MSRRTTWILGLLGGQVALLWATFQIPGLGDPIWHYGASLIFALLVVAALYRPFARSRRFLAMGIFATTILATVSGFWLLYWKEGLRADGLQDWGRFWHVLWSWFAMVFFFQHTWINRAAFVSFVKRTLGSVPGRVLHAGAYLLVVVAFVVTWSSLGKSWFTNDNYIPLSLYAWIFFSVPPYLLWTYVRSGIGSRLSSRLVQRVFRRGRVQTWFTVALVPIAALVVLSGVPLTFFDGPLEPLGLKYVSKYWHVWPSVLFSVLVFGHSIHSWHAVGAHWRSYAADARRHARTGGTDPVAFPGAMVLPSGRDERRR